MRYWWVNHKQTFRHEFDGGYIWSPKRNKNGARNRHYDFLREVVPGDVVFSYASACLQGAGFVISYCYTCPRPTEFGHVGEAWDVVGWRVDVRFQPFTDPIQPKRHLNLLQPLLAAESFSPLRLTGDGQQHIYLTPLTSKFAEVLLGLAGIDGQVFRSDAGHDAERVLIERQLSGQQEWEDIEQRRINSQDIPETTRRALISARVGQGIFKERVARIENRCRMTFVDNPVHLIASHIKPWRESNNEERLSAGNGLLLTPSADQLFDRGFITFEDTGEIIVSPVADHTSLRRMGLDPERPPRPLPLNNDQKYFLKHHRQEVFLAAAG